MLPLARGCGLDFPEMAAVSDGEALRELARSERRAGRIPETAAAYVRSIQAAPRDPVTHAELGEWMIELGAPAKALPALATAVTLDRAQVSAWLALERAVTLAPPDRLGPPLRAQLLSAIDDALVDPAQLVNLVVLAVTTLPSVVELRRWHADRAIAARLATPAGSASLVDPTLLAFLERVRMVGVALELALTELRASLLALALDRPLSELRASLLAREPAAHTALTPLAEALAVHAFATDFAHHAPPDELARVAALRAAIESSAVIDDATWFRAAVAASYAPLTALANYRALVAHRATSWANVATANEAAHGAERRREADEAVLPEDREPCALVRVHVAEPMREHALRATITAALPIDARSEHVRAQYEAAPYPRWSVQPDLRRSELARVPVARIAALEALPAPRILVAGCGTGRHPIALAMMYPRADVLALDLSIASLAYAARKAEELRVDRVRFVHGDLLAVGELAETFDAVECVGVLHHLRDPMAGWRALAGVLRPGGWMRIGLYSATARRAITELRASLPATADRSDAALRALRWDVMQRPDDPASVALTRWPDFYALAECRDLLFHVEEHVFTLPRIAACVHELGLEILQLEHASTAPIRAYEARFPDEPTLIDLDRWAILEAEQPTLFAGMYQFRVRKPA